MQQSRLGARLHRTVGLLGILASIWLADGAVAQERAGDPAKWRTFWNEMLPVFTHDRCMNCHNNVDPRLPDPENKHGGGQLELQSQFACIGCHTANTTLVEGKCELDQFSGKGKVTLLSDGKTLDGTPCVPGEGLEKKIRIPTGPVWNARGPDFTKDMRKLCQLVKERSESPEQLVHHVQTDTLIDWAFKGTAGMDGNSDYWPVELEKPPMDKPAFVNLLTRWITEAAMACGTEGTVTFDDTVKLDSKTSFGKGNVRNETTATIRIEDDVAKSKLHYDEASETKLRTMLPGCPARESVEAHFRAEGEPDTRYEINILPGDNYRMRFILGPLEGETVWSYKEQLCRPGSRGREKLPTEKTIPLRFGVEGQKAEENAEHDLVLEGSTDVPDELGVGGFVSSGSRKLTWRIVIH
jgi:hypothetical protein